jgi:hypothetical protein
VRQRHERLPAASAEQQVRFPVPSDAPDHTRRHTTHAFKHSFAHVCTDARTCTRTHAIERTHLRAHASIPCTRSQLLFAIAVEYKRAWAKWAKSMCGRRTWPRGTSACPTRLRPSF